MGLLVSSLSYGCITFLSIGQMLVQLYFILMCSDLESDFVNPMELCESLDWMVPAEAAVQAVVPAVLILIGDFKSTLIVCPITAWNVYRYKTTGFKFDATEIFRTVRAHRIEALMKFAAYFLLFCYFLFCLIWALVVFSES